MELRDSDYENYDYREFWENDKRRYEDRSERIALKKLFKNLKNAGAIADIGCGYGRLFTEYENFPMIIMLDYSLNNLKNAKAYITGYLKENGRLDVLENVLFIAGDAGNLPFKSGVLSAIVSVRLMHHLNDPGGFINEASRILKKEGLFFLEFANKRNIKNILKFFSGRLKKSPFSKEPFYVGDTIRDNHPSTIIKSLKEFDFKIIKILSVSNFRMGVLKRKVKLSLLLMAESISQIIFSFLKLGPSIFIKAFKESGKDNLVKKEENMLENASYVLKHGSAQILFCPLCRLDDYGLLFNEEFLFCPNCKSRFEIIDGVIDLRIRQ